MVFQAHVLWAFILLLVYTIATSISKWLKFTHMNIRPLWVSTNTMLLIVAATILLCSVKGLDHYGLVSFTASSSLATTERWRHSMGMRRFGRIMLRQEQVAQRTEGPWQTYKWFPGRHTTSNTGVGVWVHGMAPEPDTALGMSGDALERLSVGSLDTQLLEPRWGWGPIRAG